MTLGHDDHMHLLSLAKAAFKARDDKPSWRADVLEASEKYGAYCDALWLELERQVTLADGGIPVIEPPSIRQRRLARELRKEIIAACQDAVSDALEEIANGSFNWDD